MRAALLFVLSISALLLSACEIEIEYPDFHSNTKTTAPWATPGTYVDERLATYMEEVFDAYVPDSEKKFRDMAIELTALPPSSMPAYEVYASSTRVLELPNPTDPLPPHDTVLPWWNSVPWWRLEPPNKVVISFFHDPVWQFESVLGAAFSAFAADQSAEPAFPADIMVSDALKKRLASLFDETKTCTGFSDGEFADLAVYLMPPSFLYEGETVLGQFYAQNKILTGDREWVARHEFVHYFLWKNTGDADGSHASSFFQDCI